MGKKEKKEQRVKQRSSNNYTEKQRSNNTNFTKMVARVENILLSR